MNNSPTNDPLSDSQDLRWKNALLPIKSTIQEAISRLDYGALRIVMVLDDRGRLYGTLSDGDIRRGLLRGNQLSDPILEIVNKSPLVVPRGIGCESITQLMLANKVQQIPVVDSEHQVVGLHLWDKISSPKIRNNTMIIMAGGRGLRLHPLTEACPKPMLEVSGKPMLEHIILRAKLEGFHQFILTTHYLGHMIEEYFGNGTRLDVHIDYIKEEKPLGTAGALSLMASQPTMPFIVTNGDVLTDIRYGDLIDFHCAHNSCGTMAVRLYEWQNPFGVVETKGIEIIGVEEKPIIRSYINAGIYALEPSTLDQLSYNEHCDMTTLFGKLRLADLKTTAYPMHEPWLDVGRDSDLEKARSMQSYSSNENNG